MRVRVLRSTITSVLAKPDPAAAREAAAKRPAESRRDAKDAAGTRRRPPTEEAIARRRALALAEQCCISRNWKVLLICAALRARRAAVSLPNLFTPAQLAQLPQSVPHKQVALGLDLRGGSYLLLEVDVAAAQRERLNSHHRQCAQRACATPRSATPGLNVEGDAIVFTIREPDRIEDARQALAKIDPDLTVDIAPDGAGTMRFNHAATDARRSQAVEQSIEIIRRRIDETGTKEPTIQREGTDRILVQLPGVDNPEHVKALLGRTAKLTFQLVDTTRLGRGGAPRPACRPATRSCRPRRARAAARRARRLCRRASG